MTWTWPRIAALVVTMPIWIVGGVMMLCIAIPFMAFAGIVGLVVYVIDGKWPDDL